MPIPTPIEQLVIVCPSWVGDTVMATPLMRAARRARPGARITAACRPGIDELLAGLPWLDDIIAVEPRSVRGALRLARDLRRVRPQAILLLPNTLRSALIALLAGAPVRIGYRRYARGRLLTHRLDPPAGGDPVSALDSYTRLGAYALGLDSIEPRMELVVTESDAAAARRGLEGVPRPFAILCPGASKMPKRWPAERFAAVADALAARHGLAAVVTGTPEERDVARSVVTSATGPVRDLTGSKLGLGGLKGVIAEARIMITNDTGPRHIAAALGTPVVSLFGPTDPRWTTIDCPHEKMLVAEPFLPDGLIADDDPRGCAITRIVVGDVLSATEELLAAWGSPAPGGRDASPAPTPTD